MNLNTEKYLDAIKRWPSKGQHILAHQEGDNMTVYQAYNAQIADHAVKHQQLGGPHFSYNRMSWIKPNFLWMMYRAGWASKPNQERILAITISKAGFDQVLGQAVFSSFNAKYYSDTAAWEEELRNKEVRLQWDPDHDPHGNKEERRAIQLGLKGDMLQLFGKELTIGIEDITSFVTEQKKLVDENKLDHLLVPYETVYTPASEELGRKVGIE